MDSTDRSGSMMKRALMLLSCGMLVLGQCGGPLLTRLYFLHGGSRVWLSTCLQTGGFPILFLPLTAIYIKRSRSKDTKLFCMKPRVLFSSILLGVLTGLDDYLYSYGLAKLPVSTSTLIIATQLAFTAAFAFFLVNQRFTPYSVNAVVLLTVGAAVLGLHTSSDRPKNETQKEYLLGFFLTLAASALYGFVLPAVELTYKKAKQVVTYSVVVEFQAVSAIAATAFGMIGMLINNDFKAIPREAKEYGLGEAMYYIVLAGTAITWQLFFMGILGIVYCGSSLLSGILLAVLLPVTEVLAVIFYKEKFQAEKGVSIALSLWGFVSYFYGEFKENKNKIKSTQNIQIEELNSLKV